VEIGGYHGTEVLFSLHRFCSFPRFCKQSILKEGKKIYSPNPTKKQCESQRYHQSYYAARSIAAIRDIINSTHGIAKQLCEAQHNSVGRAKNTVMRYVDALAEKGLIYTEPTSVLMKSGIKKNGNLRYTIRPIREAIEIFHARQLSAVERAAERQRVQRKLSAMDLLPGA